MNINPHRPLFNRKPQSSIYRMFVWVVMILGGVWMLQQMNKGEIKPLFEATPIPTRSAESYILQGDANFSAGQLDASIAAYREAVSADPGNAKTWAKLARIQTYSSAFLTTDDDKRTRLLGALESARKAVELAPEDSMAHAILALTLDWNANPGLYPGKQDQVQAFLIEAEQEVLRAQQFDNTNTLALAYYAEILVDQQKWNQAEIIIKQALEQDDTSMDVHRIYAYVLETLGQYNLAITEYDKAIAIEPNFTFLYIQAGLNYRRLAFEIPLPADAKPVYEKGLEYFDKAVKINEQIGVKDPVPHIAIAKTYSQMGEFFIAARNMQTALKYQPTNADIYGQLGIIYFRSRNYETSIYSLKCATYGCSGKDSCLARGLDQCYPDLGENEVEVKGQPISPNTVVYYYTYGSVLSALSRPRDNKCGEAMKVLSQVRTELNANPDSYTEARSTILNIVQAGESICQSLAEGLVPVSSVPTDASGGLYGATATPSP